MALQRKTPDKTDRTKNLKKGPPRLTKDNQPSPEAKKAGWERRRQAQRMMDMVLEYQSMTKDQLETLSNNKNLTILELLMIRYVITGMKDNKMLIDMIDRHVPKAPQKMDIDNNISGGIATIEITGKETMKELEAKRKALLG